MKKSILLLLVLFIASFAYALEVKQDSLDVAIIPEFNQPARIGLSITGAQPGNYNIYTLTAVKILPSDSFYLNSGTNQMTVDVYPTSELVAYGPTAYAFSFNFFSNRS